MDRHFHCWSTFSLIPIKSAAIIDVFTTLIECWRSGTRMRIQKLCLHCWETCLTQHLTSQTLDLNCPSSPTVQSTVNTTSKRKLSFQCHVMVGKQKPQKPASWFEVGSCRLVTWLELVFNNVSLMCPKYIKSTEPSVIQWIMSSNNEMNNETASQQTEYYHILLIEIWGAINIISLQIVSQMKKFHFCLPNKWLSAVLSKILSRPARTELKIHTAN